MPDKKVKEGKLIVLSAPSGCGKSTILHRIFDLGEVDLTFSVSATNRNPREGEIHGTHYYFLSTEEFQDAVANNDFIEWEEVYPGRYYGTLRSEIDRKLAEGKNVVLDIDVKGAVNVKKYYGPKALTVFIEPPSVTALRTRLENRGTESPEVIETRLARAEYEISFAPQFDVTVINDNLDKAVNEVNTIIKEFINN